MSWVHSHTVLATVGTVEEARVISKPWCAVSGIAEIGDRTIARGSLVLVCAHFGDMTANLWISTGWWWWWWVQGAIHAIISATLIIRITFHDTWD